MSRLALRASLLLAAALHAACVGSGGAPRQDAQVAPGPRLDVESGRDSAVLRLPEAAPGIAALSPGGEELVYYLEQDVGADLFVLSLAGGTTSAADAQGRDYDIRCLGRDGRTNIAVISDPSDARSAAWRPGSATGPHGAAQTAAH